MTISTSDIQALYIAYFNRPADYLGLQFWTNAATQAGSVASVANAFSASPEYAALYSGKSTLEIIDSIYVNLFGRHAEPAGLSFWGNALDSGQLNIGNIAYQIFQGAQNADLVAVQSKVAAATAFYNSLDTSAKITGYDGAAADSVVKSWLSGVVDPTTLAAATTAAALNAVTGAAEAAHSGATAVNTALTTGIDTLVGNASVANVFTGTLVAADQTTGVNASTLSALDSITGAGLNNTLNINDLSGGMALNPSVIPGGLKVSGVQTVNFVSVGTIGAAASPFDASGFTGLTALNGTSTGGAYVAAAATTAVTLNDSNLGAGAISVTGGGNVAVTAASQDSGTITVAGAAGSVNVTTGIAGGLVGLGSGPAGGLIHVLGGSTINVTENITNATNTTATESDVHIDGGSTTTTVTIAQGAVQGARAATTAVAGVEAVTGVTAAPGTDGVTAVAAVAAASGHAARAGIAADGAVVITDAHYGTTGANTITSVSLSNYGGSSSISDNALATLSLSGFAGDLAINNGTAIVLGSPVAPTANSALTLNLSGLKVVDDNTITDVSNEITTLNVVTATADSELSAFVDTHLATLNVSGTNVLNLDLVNASLTAINVSGSAGFSDNGTYAALGSAVTFTTTSTGAITLTLDATTQAFTGAAGTDTITIDATVDATKVITAGSATDNELILDGGAYALTAATAAKVTGFQTVGVTAAVTGTIDMSVLDATASSLDIIGSTGIAFTKVATGASISIDNDTTGVVSVSYVNAHGSTDTTALTLGSDGGNNVTVATLLLQDANQVGIATLNVDSVGVGGGTGLHFGSVNTITSLDENGLSNLNVSGDTGLVIHSLVENTTQATSFTLTNTVAAPGHGVEIFQLIDANLGTVTFAGTGDSVIDNLDVNGSTLEIDNSGTGVAHVNALFDDNLTSLNLGAGVALGQNNFGLVDASAAGVTIAGAADNAHVTINLITGASLNNTDTITLGNANNNIFDASTSGTVHVTVGTGSNFIELGADPAGTNDTGAYTITLGAHTAATGIDAIVVGSVGNTFATAANYTITGAAKGDTITLNVDSNAAGTAAHNAVTAVTTGATLALSIANLESALATGHGVFSVVFGGNTYIGDSAGGAPSATDTSIVELIGTHTFTATAGVVTVVS